MTSPITWKRDTTRGGHVGAVGGRQVARIVRLGPSEWRWSYRGPSQVLAIVDEARLLKHAKEAVERLHASKAIGGTMGEPASSVRRDIQRFVDILDDVLEGYCETCRMAPCVCVRPAPQRDCTADDPAGATREKDAARDHAAGEGPRGDQVRDRERPDNAERVKSPHLCPKEAEKDGHVAGLHLNASGGTDDGCRRGTERSCQETEAGRRVGRAVDETAPGGGGVREHQSLPSIRTQPGVERVESPPLWGQPLEVESTPQTMWDFREGDEALERRPSTGDERVEGPHPAAPRGMVSGESPERVRLMLSETPRGAAPISQLSLLEGEDPC